MSVQVEVHRSQRELQDQDPLSSEADLSNGSEEAEELEFTGKGISKPGPQDVLLGRGGGTNNHAGNIRFRQLVNEHKIRYLACSKVDKPKVARDVVELWRSMTPPGRFLARKDETKRGPGSIRSTENVWYEVSDKKAREKASQCLRERTPEVMPYIKQLREQQDAITEKGVSMVQQQLQMQQRQDTQPFQATLVGANQMLSIKEHGSMVVMQQPLNQQYMEHPVHQQQVTQNRMAPVIRCTSLPEHQQQITQNGMAPVMRRTSLPEPIPHHLGMTPSNGYGQQRSMSIGLGTVSHGPHGSLQQRSMSLGHGMASQNGTTVYMSSTGAASHFPSVNLQQMQPSMSPGIQQVSRYHLTQNGAMAPQTVVSQDYHQQMMIQQSQIQGQHFVMQPIQQQVLPQHMQQQQMQFQQPQMMTRVAHIQQQQMMVQPQHLHMQHQHNQLGQILQMPNQQQGHHVVTADSLFQDDNEPEPYNAQSDPLFVMPTTVLNQTEDSEKVDKRANKDSLKEICKGAANAPAKAALKQDRDVPDKRKAPARTPTGTSLMSIGTSIGTPRTSDLEAGGEITIEEYRKQLQEYIENNQVKPTEGNRDDDDINYPSDLEDDWEKEREKNMREDKTRGVGRNVSGMSFMSSKTAKSGNSMVSGISAGIFSADMSDATPTKKGTSNLHNSSRSLCSNLSIMSELTDLSENIDTLTLDD